VRITLVLALAVALLAAGTAAARPPTPAEKKAAKAHFDQGRAYYDAGGYLDAVREYEQAYALVPLPELLFNIGQAWRLKGDKPQAIAAYQRYLDAAPDGALADDARTHVASLKLKIQLEEAEAARRKAAEEAAAARKRADEAEAARRRAEAEAAARLAAQHTDEERLRRVAAEEAEAFRRRKEAAEARHARELEEAQGRGKVLRVTGNVCIVTGSLALVTMVLPAIVVVKARDNIDQWNHDSNANRPFDAGWLNEIHTAKTVLVALGVAGGTLLVTGVVLRIVGGSMRSRAVERVAPVSVGAAPLPGGAAFVAAGRF
jgi:tetratricopeptide (TPR) repeat protein